MILIILIIFRTSDFEEVTTEKVEPNRRFLNWLEPSRIIIFFGNFSWYRDGQGTERKIRIFDLHFRAIPPDPILSCRVWRSGTIDFAFPEFCVPMYLTWTCLGNQRTQTLLFHENLVFQDLIIKLINRAVDQSCSWSSLQNKF